MSSTTTVPPVETQQAPRPSPDQATERTRVAARRARRAQRRGLLFISPWIVRLLVFAVVPIVYSVYNSPTQYSGIGSPRFVGLSNYESLFTDPIAGLSA